MAGAIVIAGCLTAVMMLFSLVGLYPLMRLLKTPESILSESYSYISVLTIFIGVMFAYNLCAGLLRAIGNSLMPLLFLIFSSIGNVLLDLLFITQFDMGIRGAAIATVVAQGYPSCYASFISCAMRQSWCRSGDTLRQENICTGTAFPGRIHGDYECSGSAPGR